eukprot:519782_1
MSQNNQHIVKDIVPYKAYTSNNLDSMHHYLVEKIKSINQMCDLLPFLDSLISLDQLKKILESELQKQYDLQKSQEMRSLFLSSLGLQIIPSEVQAKILSYLPSTDYQKLPVVSKHFRNIMRNHTWIFNEKGYTLKLYFSMSYFDSDTGTTIITNHKNQEIEVWATENRVIKDFAQSPIQIDKIMNWTIGFECGYNEDEPNYSDAQLEDKEKHKHY